MGKMILALTGLVGRSTNGLVEETVKNVAILHNAVSKKFPASVITEHRQITAELIRAGTMPRRLVKDGKGLHAWGAPVCVWLLPAAAWGPGSPATVNYVFELVPQKACAPLVEALSRQSAMKIYRMNIEPSKNVYTTFPIAKVEGCYALDNNVGFTVLAGA